MDKHAVTKRRALATDARPRFAFGAAVAKRQSFANAALLKVCQQPEQRLAAVHLDQLRIKAALPCGLNDHRLSEVSRRHCKRVMHGRRQRAKLHCISQAVAARKGVMPEPPQAIEQNAQPVAARAVVKQMNFIEHDGANVLEHARAIGQQGIERFRRRQQQLRRAMRFECWLVAGLDLHGNGELL